MVAKPLKYMHANPYSEFVFDFRGDPFAIGPVAPGGTANGYIVLDDTIETIVGTMVGVVHILQITSDLSTDTDIEFFADAGRTDSLYEKTAMDAASTPYFDNKPWAVFTFDNVLAEGRLYYTLTNNGGGMVDSNYEIEVYGQGRRDFTAPPPP